MTRQERHGLLRHVPDGIESSWREVDDTFVALKAHPCPFFIFKGCVVYEHRPYNCRRFACMRPDPKAEPVKTDGQLSAAVMDRVKTSRVARRMAQLIQRRAQPWSLRHGWPQS